MDVTELCGAISRKSECKRKEARSEKDNKRIRAAGRFSCSRNLIICLDSPTARGLPVIAHFGWSFKNYSRPESTEAILRLREEGIAGIECYHPSYRKIHRHFLKSCVSNTVC